MAPPLHGRIWTPDRRRRVVVASGGAPPGSSLLTDLIAWWSMDETSGTRADSHGSFDLTPTGSGTGSTTGVVGNAGTTDNSVPGQFTRTDAGLRFEDEDFTFAGWFRSTDATFTILGGVWGGAGSRSYVLYLNTTIAFLVTSNGTTVGSVSATGPAANTWFFAAGHHDAANNLLGVSLNGAAWTTTPYSDGVYSGGTLPFYLGEDGGAGGDVDMDEVALWGRVLTSAELATLYNSGSGVAYSSL